MTASTPYFEKVRLLVAVLPIVAEQTCFALKGGTAINLFVQLKNAFLMSAILVYHLFRSTNGTR